MKKPLYTKQEDKEIARLYPEYGAKGVASKIDRTEPSIHRRAHRLGVMNEGRRLYGITDMTGIKL